MADIVEELRSFSNWMVSCCLGSIPGEAKMMADAADEITSLRSHLEQAERERDELRKRVDFTLTDHQRLLQRSDIESVCDTPDLCFAEGGPVRCGPCAIKQSEAQNVKCLDWLPFAPEQYRLKRRAEAAEASLAKAVEVIRPFAKSGELFGEPNAEGFDQCIYRPAKGDEWALSGNHLRKAAEFIKEIEG